jgi:hypothetical protein
VFSESDFTAWLFSPVLYCLFSKNNAITTKNCGYPGTPKISRFSLLYDLNLLVRRKCQPTQGKLEKCEFGRT